MLYGSRTLTISPKGTLAKNIFTKKAIYKEVYNGREAKRVLRGREEKPDDDDAVDADFREIPDKKEDKEKDDEDSKE